MLHTLYFANLEITLAFTFFMQHNRLTNMYNINMLSITVSNNTFRVVSIYYIITHKYFQVVND